jgi:hypothetical protein
MGGGVQEFRSSGVAGVQEFRSTGVAGVLECLSARVLLQYSATPATPSFKASQ